MKLIIQDNVLPLEVGKNVQVFSPEEKILPCIGCFHCWIRTPGQCVLSDAYSSLPAIFSEMSDIYLLSRMSYGSVSSFVKNVLDRSLGFLLPFFQEKDGLSIHPLRYPGRFTLHYCIYGEASLEEKKTLTAMAGANGRNLEAETSVSFFSSWEELQEAISDDWTD